MMHMSWVGCSARQADEPGPYGLKDSLANSQELQKGLASAHLLLLLLCSRLHVFNLLHQLLLMLLTLQTRIQAKQHKQASSCAGQPADANANSGSCCSHMYMTPSHGRSGLTHPVAGAFQLVLQLDDFSLSLHTEEEDQRSKG